MCENVSIEVTDKMAKSLENETRSQSKRSLWFKHQAGRVTTSCMKQVCHTDVTNPAQSLFVIHKNYHSVVSKQTGA